MSAQNTPFSGSSANSTTDLKDRAAGQFDKFADSANQTLHNAADQAGQLASRVAEQGHDVGVKMQEVAGNLKGAVDKSVKDQPMATLAMVAVLGFVLGAIWKS